MTAVKHANGKDWWLIVISGRFVESDSTFFENFLIKSDSISKPQLQFYDLWSSSLDALFTEVGEMKFSPSGQKLVNTRGSDIDIYDFDRCTGMLSNRIIIDTVHSQTCGIEFSPDESKLYVSTWGQSPNKSSLLQICLDCGSFSKTTLFTRPISYYFGHLQIASDKKIYVCFGKEGIVTEDFKYLSVINYPDSFGVACDFDTATIQLGDTAYVFL